MGMNYQEQLTASFVDELEKIGGSFQSRARAAARRAASMAKSSPAPTKSLGEAADALDKVDVSTTAADIMKGVNAATAPARAASAAADAAKPVAKGLSTPEKALIGGGAAVGVGGTYAALRNRDRK